MNAVLYRTPFGQYGMDKKKNTRTTHPHTIKQFSRVERILIQHEMPSFYPPFIDKFVVIFIHSKYDLRTGAYTLNTVQYSHEHVMNI